MSRNISPESVRFGRACLANLGVRSCPVRKLICPVRSSPNQIDSFFHKYNQKMVHIITNEKRKGEKI